MTYTKSEPSLINNIIRVTSLPCAIPPAVLVETAVPGFLDAIWTYVIPDKKEGYHILRGKSLVCDSKGVISYALEKSGIEEGVTTRILFTSLEWIDLGVWYLFLASLVRGALLSWSSGILEQHPCTDGSISCTSTRTQGGISSGPNAFWSGLEFLYDQGDPCFPAGASGIEILPGETCTIAAQVDFVDTLQVPTPAMSRIVNLESGAIHDFYDPYVQSGDPAKGRPIWAQFTNHSRNAQVLECQWMGTQTVDTNQLFPSKAFFHISKTPRT